MHNMILALNKKEISCFFSVLKAKKSNKIIGTLPKSGKSSA